MPAWQPSRSQDPLVAEGCSRFPGGLRHPVVEAAWEALNSFQIRSRLLSPAWAGTPAPAARLQPPGRPPPGQGLLRPPGLLRTCAHKPNPRPLKQGLQVPGGGTEELGAWGEGRRGRPR